MNADERRIADVLTALEDVDFQLDEPPADLWDRVAGAALTPGVTELTDRRRPRRRLVPLAAAAAVVAVLVAGGAVVRRAADPGRVAAEAALSSDGLPARSGLVGGAELVERDGRREIDLDLPGLPDPGGSYYELWLLAPDGDRLQSLGITSGTGRYPVPAGIDPERYPVVDVSREPTDGNPAHSGDSLVRGRLQART